MSSGSTRKTLLGNDRTRVDVGGHEVDGRAGLAVARSEDRAMHPHPVHSSAPVAGEEGRVDVDRPALPAFDPTPRQDRKESGEDDELDPFVEELGSEPVRPHVRVDPVGREDDRGDPSKAGAFDRGRVRPVGDHEGDPNRKVPPDGELGEAFEGGALSGDEHRDRERSRHEPTSGRD